MLSTASASFDLQSGSDGISLLCLPPFVNFYDMPLLPCYFLGAFITSSEGVVCIFRFSSGQVFLCKII